MISLEVNSAEIVAEALKSFSANTDEAISVTMVKEQTAITAIY